MNARSLGLTALLIIAAPVAMAQRAPVLSAAPVTADAVGHWLYDERGNLIGSLRGLSDDGATATVMLGVYFQPGSRQVVIPSGALTVIDGKVTLRSRLVEALNRPASR